MRANTLLINSIGFTLEGTGKISYLEFWGFSSNVMPKQSYFEFCGFSAEITPMQNGLTVKII